MAKKKSGGGITPSASIEEKKKINKQTYILEAVILGIVVFYVFLSEEAYMSVHPMATFSEALGALPAVIAENPLFFWPITYSIASATGVTSLVLLFVLLQYETTKFRIRGDFNAGGRTEWGKVKEISEHFGEYLIKKGILPFKFLEKKDYASAYNNAIMSKNLWVSVDAEKHFHALNCLIIGASGSGKTRFWLKPNLLQMNCSYAITDPKGEILDSCGETLRRNGYDIKVFDIVEQGRCNTYNPLKYCKRESDIKKIVAAFMKNTDSSHGKGGGSKDPFWDDSMSAFLCACIGFLTSKPEGSDVPYAQIPEVTGGLCYEACFPNLCDLTRMANNKWTPQSGIELMDGVQLGDGKNNTANASELAAIFENLRYYECTKIQHLSPEEADQMVKPYCLREWENFRIAPEKTSTTILMTTAVRLDPFNIEQIKNLTSTDTIDLYSFATHRTALFLIMPATDKTYNFLLAFLYTQLFDILYQFGEKQTDGSKYLALKNGEMVKWFSREDVAKDKFVDKAVENIKDATIKKVSVNGIQHGKCKGKNGKKKPFTFDDAYYEILAKDGTLVTRRATEADAKTYLHELQLSDLEDCSVPKLPTHFRFLIDEFPSIGEIPEFKEKLSTMRGYNISATVICQSITQLKGMYPDDYEVIDANCPFFVFLGGDENTNNEYIAKKIGKTTTKGLDNSIGAKKDVSSSIKTENVELMRAEDIGRIAFSKCMVFIYGEMPVLDDKFDVVDHKNFKMSKEFLTKKCGIKAMNFERDVYKDTESVVLTWRGSKITAIPDVIIGDNDLVISALKTFLKAKNNEDTIQKANANLERFSFEANSTPTPF